MKSLQTLATNPFVFPLSISSRDRIIQFGDDTVGRFEANNPAGVYTAMLDELKANLEGYKTGITDAQLGSRKAATQSVEGMQETIADTGRRLYAKLQDSFGLKSPILMIFFPAGLSSINRAKRGSYDTIINNWVKIAPKHPYVDKLGNEWIKELDKLKSDWTEAIATQSGAKEEVGDGSATAESFIEPMANSLWSLLLLVIQNNPPHAQNVVGNYFDTTPLEPRENKDNDGLGRTFGTVKDGAGTGLPAVQIVAKNADSQIIWSGKTSGEGKWRTKNIAVGMYHLTFTKPGYAPTDISHEILDDGDTEVEVVLVVS